MAGKTPVESLEPVSQAKSQKSSQIITNLYTGLSEQTYQVSPYVPDSYKRPYNPDPLVMLDYTYGIYDEMLRDDQVDVALKLKKDLVVGSGWYIESQDEAQADIKKELENSLSDDTDRPLSEILEDIIQGYEYGFSVAEKIFKLTDDGLLALKDIKPRHPASWLLHTDDHGNVTKYEQRAASGSLDIDPNSIIHYVNNQKFQNPYGRSDLYVAHQAWMTKRHITRFYAIYLENAAGPKAIAKYDRKAPATVVTDIFNAIKNFQAKSAMAIPKDFDVEFLEAKTNGEAFIKGINLFNMFIGRALFIPDLLGFQGSETGGGSFALGTEQIGVFYKHIYRRRQILERIIDQHVIRPLVIYNYGIQDDYPKFKFLPLSQDDAMKQAELWIKGIQGAGWKPSLEEVNHFRQLVKFPQADELEMKSDAMAQALSGDPANPNDGENMMDSADSQDQMDKKKEFKLNLSSLPGDYKNKTDFKMADQLLKAILVRINHDTEPIVSAAFEDLYTQLQDKKIVQSQDLSKAENIGIKGKYLKALQQVFKTQFRRLYQDAQSMAKTEVKKSDFVTNIPADEFLAFLESESFKYVGDWEYTITKKTKDLLIKAIKDGEPLSNVISVLDDEGKNLSDISIERFARTKATEVFNRGRMEYFESTGVVAAYQYSAIIDDVTSEICSELNGKIFEKGDEPVPPLHFNCRSVLIPITRFEDYEADSKTNSGKNIDSFLQKNVSDKGFPIYSLDEKPEIISKPEITDIGVNIRTQIDGLIEITTYSKDSKDFQISTAVYRMDGDSKVLESLTHKRVDDAAKI